MLLLLLLPVTASAGTISLVLATRVSVAPSGLRVELDVHNQGDEAALNVTPTIEFQGRITPASRVLASLAPGAAETIVFEVPYLGPTQPRGRWPLLLRVSYVDGGQYPFDALHVDLVSFDGERAPSDLRIQVPNTHVETETTVRVRVGRGSVGGAVRVAFATPEGVITTPREFTVASGDATASVSLTITRLSATLNSRLPLVAIAEFDNEGVHDTVVAVSMIDIGPAPARARVQVVAILFGVAVATWVVIALVTARRRRRAHDEQ